MDGGGLEGRGNELVGKEGQVKTGRSEGESLGDIRSEVWSGGVSKKKNKCARVCLALCAVVACPPHVQL